MCYQNSLIKQSPIYYLLSETNTCTALYTSKIGNFHACAIASSKISECVEIMHTKSVLALTPTYS